jgi:hydroxymethylpyrimidine pyrophosphatase-like HAD family hydrolase
VIPDIHVTKSVSGTGEKSQSVHVTNINATKQVAVGKLLEILKLKKEQVIGIGDSYNDFPLLLSCGLKVAMENAMPEIKEIADYIASSYEEEGVVKVLEKFILK